MGWAFPVSKLPNTWPPQQGMDASDPSSAPSASRALLLPCRPAGRQTISHLLSSPYRHPDSRGRAGRPHGAGDPQPCGPWDPAPPRQPPLQQPDKPRDPRRLGTAGSSLAGSPGRTQDSSSTSRSHTGVGSLGRTWRTAKAPQKCSSKPGLQHRGSPRRACLPAAPRSAHRPVSDRQPW